MELHGRYSGILLKLLVTILKVCEDNRETINSDIAEKVIDFQLKRSIEDYLQRLKPIVFAGDRAQRDNCTISELNWLDN